MKLNTILTVLIVICAYYALNAVLGMFVSRGIWGILEFDGYRYLTRTIQIVYYVFLALFFYKLNSMYKKEIQS